MGRARLLWLLLWFIVVNDVPKPWTAEEQKVRTCDIV